MVNGKIDRLLFSDNTSKLCLIATVLCLVIALTLPFVIQKMGCMQTLCDFCFCCGAPALERGPFRAGINFTPFTLKQKVTLTEGSEFPVRRLTFSLPDPYEVVGFKQPTTNVKVRRPGLLPRSRTYSITSNPKNKGEFDLTVKIYDKGVVSSYLDSVEIGENVWMSKTRTKTLAPGEKNGIIAFGVAVAEVLWVIRDILSQESSRQVRLVIANRHFKDLLSHKELNKLETEFPSQLSITYLFSRESVTNCTEMNPKFTAGRLSTSIVRQLFLDWRPEVTKFWVIGTKQMKKATAKYLNEGGFPDFKAKGGKGHLLEKPRLCS